MGRQSVPMHCWRTAPTVTSEASVMIQVGASSLGYAKSNGVARASLIWLKVLSAVGVQCKGAWLFWVEESILFRGTRVAAQLGTKQ